MKMEIASPVNLLPIKVDTSYHLTKAEERILVVLCDPANRDKTVVDICKVAEVCRETYYRAIQKPHFTELAQQLAIAVIKQQVIPLVNSGIAAAKQGSFQHWKVLMEMGGLYDPKRIDPEDGGTITVRFVDPRQNVTNV
jgi:hypothetical protein